MFSLERGQESSLAFFPLGWVPLSKLSALLLLELQQTLQAVRKPWWRPLTRPLPVNKILLCVREGILILISAFLTEKRGKHFLSHRCFHRPAACQEMLGLWCQPKCRQYTTMHRLKKLNKRPWNGLEMWLSVYPVCIAPGFYPQLRRKERGKKWM